VRLEHHQDSILLRTALNTKHEIFTKSHRPDCSLGDHPDMDIRSSLLRAHLLRTILLPLDIAFLRIVGAGSVLLPWAWWLMRPQRQAGEKVGSLLGLSPLPIRITIIGGLFGSFVFSMLSYSGFFFAPATHASVLLPGSLPLWTTLMAWLVLSQSISKVRAIGLVSIVLGDLLVGGSSLLKAFDGGVSLEGRRDVYVRCMLLVFLHRARAQRRFRCCTRHHGSDCFLICHVFTAVCIGRLGRTHS